MTIKDAYVCPKCKNTNPTVLAIQSIMNDVRYDVVQCPACMTEWRAYYKVSEVSTEVTFVGPDKPMMEPDADMQAPEGVEDHEVSK